MCLGQQAGGDGVRAELAAANHREEAGRGDVLSLAGQAPQLHDEVRVSAATVLGKRLTGSGSKGGGVGVASQSEREAGTTRALFPCVTRGSGWRCAARRPAAASASRTTHARSCPSRPPPSEQLWLRKVATKRGGGKRQRDKREKWWGSWLGAAAYGRGSGSTPGMPASMSCRYRLIQQPSGMSPIVKLSPPAQHQPHLRPSDSRRPESQAERPSGGLRTKVGPVGKDLLVYPRPLLGDGLSSRRQRPHVPLLRRRPDDLPASTEG